MPAIRIMVLCLSTVPDHGAVPNTSTLQVGSWTELSYVAHLFLLFTEWTGANFGQDLRFQSPLSLLHFEMAQRIWNLRQTYGPPMIKLSSSNVAELGTQQKRAPDKRAGKIW